MYVRGLRKIRIFFTIQLCSLIFVMGLRAASRPRRGREGRMLSPSLSRYFYVLLFPSSFSGSDVVWRNMSESKPFDGIMPKCREYTSRQHTTTTTHALMRRARRNTHDMTWCDLKHDGTPNMTLNMAWPETWNDLKHEMTSNMAWTETWNDLKHDKTLLIPTYDA